MMDAFDYSLAFSRNEGILTKTEQSAISKVRIGIAGMGGVGGEYLVTLVRMGFQNFRICDFDAFELQNFNRQFGANLHSINKFKTETMKKMALEINPLCNIEIINTPIHDQTVNDFIKGCDLIIDGIDFFALDTHRLLINASRKFEKTCLAAVPLGFGAGMVIFRPDGMCFDKFFRFEKAKNDLDKAILFALGFGIGGYHLSYTQHDSFKLKDKKGASIISGIRAASGLVCTAALKEFLWPNENCCCPYVTHLDFRRTKISIKKLRHGNNGVVQSLKFFIAQKRYA